RDRVLQEAGGRVDGPGRPRQPAPRRDRGRADEGPRRVDVPLHRAGHDRWRHLRGTEEHHRPPQARPAEELLMTGPLARTTVLDLSSVGPAARAGAWLADYGACVIKVAPLPKDAAAQIPPPVHAYSGG